MIFSVTEKVLHFKKPARTSRGEYTVHRMLLVTLTDGVRYGIGECAPLPDLSCDRAEYDDLSVVEALVRDAIGNLEPSEELKLRLREKLNEYPALLFALESALAEMTADPFLYGTSFARSQVGIPVNGLVWMADYDTMLRQVEEKLSQGYSCVKLKIGAIRWEDEINLIKIIRSGFGPDKLQLRVDANGAFSEQNVDAKLEELARYNLHSIEQPVRQGQIALMSRLCKESPLPIALDEELIGLNTLSQKQELLDAVRPQFIVVKPTLHGGFSGAREWISEAGSRGIRSWITSALESNVGLKSIALLTASIYDIKPDMMAQGLGTGLLFTDNINNGVELRDGRIWISGRME